MIKVLFLDDNPRDAEFVMFQLADSRYEVTHVKSKTEYLKALDDHHYDIILSDYLLPGFGGEAALIMGRERYPTIPVIFVSGIIGEELATEAIKNGATDYVLKSNLKRLPGVIHRALREAQEKQRRIKVETDLRALNDTLEQRVAQRTTELECANRELIAQIEETRKVEATLRQMHRLEAVGQVTAGVAHDFNNLLTVILGNIEFIALTQLDAKTERRVEQIKEAALRGAKLTTQLLSFARRQKLAPSDIDVNEVVQAMRSFLSASIGGLGLDVFPHARKLALADRTQMELAILNLCLNGRDAIPNTGTITILTKDVTVTSAETSPGHPEPGEYVMISVRDTGDGIPDNIRDRVLEPFFTTKAVGKGHGLGLAHIFGFVKQSGGGMIIDSKVGHGTTVEMYFPLANVATLSETKPTIFQKVEPASVYLIDDDDAVRGVVADMLTSNGHIVRQSSSGEQALEDVEKDVTADLFVVDYAMPTMTGLDFAIQLRARRPHAPILFVTGYADAIANLSIDNAVVLQKPFSNEELLKKVSQAIRP